MEEYFELFKDWVIGLGEKHEVNPLTLGSLYLISKVSFFSLLGWVVKNLRAKKPIVVLLLIAFSCFSLPYVYLLIAGRNLSVWVYILIPLLFIYGGFTAWRKVTEKQNLPEAG